MRRGDPRDDRMMTCELCPITVKKALDKVPGVATTNIDFAKKTATVMSVALAALIALGGCATAPINPPIAHADPAVGYRIQNRPSFARHKEDIVVLAFSGGGTRAAAFSYGVLEVLRDTVVIGPKGERQRLLDLVDVIAGVSGGSFTALAYGLYGDRLFGEYEQRFLKRNVEGELIGRVLNPVNWGSLARPIGAAPSLPRISTTRSCSTARRSPTCNASRAR